MDIQQNISIGVVEALKSLYDLEVELIDFQPTRKDFDGDLTLVVFPYLRSSRKGPEQTAVEIGEYLKEKLNEVEDFNVVKGFLNLVISDKPYVDFLSENSSVNNFGFVEVNENSTSTMVEYSSPNTNKPLHLGHIRNNLLGYSVAEIIKASGNKVYKTQIINDRGIHICKSMLAWEKFGEGATPESTGLKGDKLVGAYYVEFDRAYKVEVKELVNGGMEQKEAEKRAPLMLEAQQMLRSWEAKDAEVIKLWEMMNKWVYDGFEVTYNNLGVDFDKNYYESNTYLLGKEIIAKGIEKGVFFKKEDGSVWCDLTAEGLDEKIVLRSDGTAVYMTQDIGTAIERAIEFGVDEMIYTVGNEQDYHFKVLFLILDKLGYDWAKKLYHLSYGMVDLPSGKMKSREGTVVDADDLMVEMTDTARAISEELGKLEEYSEEKKAELYTEIGMGALKYFMLKVDPKKRMLFDPKESIDFNGNTGPFIQYTHARIKSILRKAGDVAKADYTALKLHDKEKELVKHLMNYPNVIQLAAKNYSPALIANYSYDLVKLYNSFYQNVSILKAEDEVVKSMRVDISAFTASVIASSMKLLGITVPERM
ncbi:MAG: arginine--tRNA ligase [Ichthyobacteriaceae bacterium]|nr:arginine--tRNA ligase [Ichthyobacteriaceae bacterium]